MSENGSILLSIDIIIAFVSILITTVVVYAINKNYVDIAMRILEIVATAVISGFGGYQAGKKNNRQTEQTKEIKE